MHLIFSVQNSIVICATWSVMDKELRIVVASPWFATKKEVGPVNVIMCQAFYLLTYFIFTLLTFCRCGTEGLGN